MIEYEDRYLSNPVACALLLDVIHAIKLYYEKIKIGVA